MNYFYQKLFQSLAVLPCGAAVHVVVGCAVLFCYFSVTVCTPFSNSSSCETRCSETSITSYERTLCRDVL